MPSNSTWGVVFLGLTNHLYFHHFEPKNSNGPLLALALQPFLLLIALSVPLTVSTLLATSFIFYATMCASIAVYRISPVHPLAHVPGPLMNKITKLWGMRIVSTGNQHRINKALHDRYGPFVRTGPNEVSIIHVDAVKAVLGAGGFQKGQYYEPRADPSLPASARSLLSLRGDAHAARRRIWNRGLSSAALGEYEGILERRVGQLMERLEETASMRGGKVDIAAWFGYFTFDFMGDMAFGGGFEMLRDGGDKHGLWAIIDKGAKGIVIVSQIPWFVPTLYLVPGATRGLQKLRKFGKDCAERRIREGAAKAGTDLWYHLMDEAEVERTKPSFAEVVADGVLSIIAGSDTTSTALSCFVWCILTHPDIYARVQSEVDRVFPDEDSLLDIKKQEELVFLTACLNETLRLHPPVPTNGTRQVPAGGGKDIAGCYIPEHTQIYIPAYSLHRNPEYFAEPEKFDPDRWLRDDDSTVINQNAFIPFSYGAANCVGKALAWREMLMVASSLLRKFDVRFAAGFESKGRNSWPERLEDLFVTSVAAAGGLMVDLERRGRQQ